METRHGSRNGGRYIAAAGFLGLLALRTDEALGRRRPWRNAAEVDHMHLGGFRMVDGHEAIAADIACAGERHGQRESHGNRCIDRIAAPLQDVGTDATRNLVL